VIALSFIAIVAIDWRALADFGLRDYLAVALFVVLCLTLGHLLGGEDPEVRTLLAIESAMRNPALALLIAETNAPHARFAALLVPYYVTFIVLTNAYRFWRRHKPSRGGTGSKMTTSPS
jgi:BASS family bile acid:Na+ symporter